ncbi:alanyl-tRNA editing protein [Bradyrhizobium sp. LHD-71]|uniref:alanyl-tRNA editing protein n=1 Tax=Bradyrhizobium sp. LHD-71 TaxID=3072141 RepID=UPI00280D744C|nr:alanyl-tRNA editing protein [Bradyrhizobium sp. LHD-71]MDQ8729169.1 alanyl-tRNA editing protein [Bradyrhizobium sp. LHD-71]
MSRLYYHEHSDTLTLETKVINAAPGRVMLAESPFFPGGGGQLADKGLVRWNSGEVPVVGFEPDGGRMWLLLGAPVELSGSAEAVVDPAFRQIMRELHTDTHLLNAFVYQQFDGALVTGVQMNHDGTARMDFDLPDADNERLRALDGPINDAIRTNLAVGDSYIPLDEVIGTPGLIRTRSAAPPPTPDGKVRIVDIADLDRQACGGTHLASTGGSRPVRVLKIENKGRHNRRVKIGLVGIAPGT